MNNIRLDGFAAHALQAKYYKYRAPYLKAFFSSVANELHLTRDSRLVDVCCGNGDLATGFSELVGRIYAFDGSEEMLSFAPRLQNVVYSQHDVNSTTFKAPESVDYLFIGRAIHWIETRSLIELIQANLGPSGGVAICMANWDPSAPWYLPFHQLLAKYRGSQGPELDQTGRTKLTSEAGFEVVERVAVKARTTFELGYLVLHALSRSYGETFLRISADLDQFKRALARDVAPTAREDGKFEGDINNWALVYRRTRHSTLSKTV